MNIIKQLIIRYWKKLRDANLQNLLILTVLIAGSICLVKYYNFLLESAGNTIIENHKYFIKYIVPICIVIGYFHAKMNKDREYNPLLLKFFSSPLILSCLVCLTYGVVIDSSLALLFVMIYDTGFISKFPYLDSTTVTVTLLLALLWALNGILTIIGSLIWPDKSTIGLTEKTEE